MNQNNRNLNSELKEDYIDYILLIKNLWRERNFILRIVGLSFIIGCIFAITSPIIFTSETTFVPQVSEDQMSPVKNGLGSLASLAGINLNTSSPTGDSYLSPLLYSKIVESDEFSLKLIQEQIINLNGDKFTIKDYLLSDESSSTFNFISKTKSFLTNLFVNNNLDNEKNIDALNNYNFITVEDQNLIKLFKGKFSIELNEKQGYIKVIATDKDAFISSQLVSKITTILQSKIIELRTNKIKERLDFSKEQYQLKQNEFNLLQKKLAEFKDSNKNISTASFLSEQQKLQSEYELQENILINLASEYNKNKIQLNKDTPIFSVLDEVSVPNKRSAPDRTGIVLRYLLLGFVIACAIIVLKKPAMNFIVEFKK